MMRVSYFKGSTRLVNLCFVEHLEHHGTFFNFKNVPIKVSNNRAFEVLEQKNFFFNNSI